MSSQPSVSFSFILTYVNDQLDIANNRENDIHLSALALTQGDGLKLVGRFLNEGDPYCMKNTKIDHCGLFVTLSAVFADTKCGVLKYIQVGCSVTITATELQNLGSLESKPSITKRINFCLQGYSFPHGNIKIDFEKIGAYYHVQLIEMLLPWEEYLEFGQTMENIGLEHLANRIKLDKAKYLEIQEIQKRLTK